MSIFIITFFTLLVCDEQVFLETDLYRFLLSIAYRIFRTQCVGKYISNNIKNVDTLKYFLKCTMKQIKSHQKKRSSKTTYEKEYLQMKKEKVFYVIYLPYY